MRQGVRSSGGQEQERMQRAARSRRKRSGKIINQGVTGSLVIHASHTVQVVDRLPQSQGQIDRHIIYAGPCGLDQKLPQLPYSLATTTCCSPKPCLILTAFSPFIYKNSFSGLATLLFPRIVLAVVLMLQVQGSGKLRMGLGIKYNNLCKV